MPCVRTPWLLLAALCGPAAAADDPRCLAEYRAEEARLQREAARAAAASPPGRDLQAQQRLMQPVHDGLKAAAERAEQCNRRSRPAPSPDAALRQAQCAEQADRQMAALRQRLAGAAGPGVSPSREAQAAQRAEETRIADERMRCLQQAR